MTCWSGAPGWSAALAASAYPTGSQRGHLRHLLRGRASRSPSSPGHGRDELRRLAEEAGTDTSAGGFSDELGQVWRFVNSIEVGDYVVTVNGQEIYLGVVASGPRSVGDRARRETVRSVEWLNADRPVCAATCRRPSTPS